MRVAIEAELVRAAVKHRARHALDSLDANWRRSVRQTEEASNATHVLGGTIGEDLARRPVNVWEREVCRDDCYSPPHALDRTLA